MHLKSALNRHCRARNLFVRIGLGISNENHHSTVLEDRTARVNNWTDRAPGEIRTPDPLVRRQGH